MALKDLLKAPLDTSHADAQIFMERLQGNILKSHDRYHSAHIFTSFNSEIGAARSWIAGDMSRRLTSAKKQSEHTKAWKATRGAGETFFAFLLSYQGYVRLGVADTATPIAARRPVPGRAGHDKRPRPTRRRHRATAVPRA